MIKTKIMIRNKLNAVFALITGIAMCLASCSSKPSSTSEAESREGKEATIRVMSYNIHHSNPPGKEGVIDIDAIARVIKSEDPDLVALQEVDVNTKRSGPFNQAKEIADDLDMHFFFGKALDYQGGGYGVAILSKFPLKDTSVHRLPAKEGSNVEPRIVATARIELPNGTAIRFGSTHLDARRDSANRQSQVEEVVRIAEREQLPFILAGDFNAVPNSEVMQTVKNQFKLSCQKCPLTSSAQNPVRTIDYIVFKDPSNKLRVQDHEVINEDKASDHLPVVAEFKVLE
jgi:endonuclease/exonuclease/phosphatase family metal-dependent hydrolase